MPSCSRATRPHEAKALISSGLRRAADNTSDSPLRWPVVARERAEACTRSIAEQFSDGSGVRRRANHPHEEVVPLHLLSDDELDAFRARHPERSTAAFAAYEELQAQLAEEAAWFEAARAELEKRTRTRPTLTFVVCKSCGGHELAMMNRAWPLDRAMRRTGALERELVAVEVLLRDACCTTSLDALGVDELRELMALVGQDVDLETLRARYQR